MLNSKFICVIGTIPTYLEREKVGERECMNFGNVITEIPVARLAYPECMCCVLEVGCAKKKTNCGNTIAEIGEEKKICGNALLK